MRLLKPHSSQRSETIESCCGIVDLLGPTDYYNTIERQSDLLAIYCLNKDFRLDLLLNVVCMRIDMSIYAWRAQGCDPAAGGTVLAERRISSKHQGSAVDLQRLGARAGGQGLCNGGM